MTYIYQSILSLFAIFSTWTLSDWETLTNIIQNFIVVVVTLFTAWWAYSTFGHKEKTDELMAIAKKIMEIHTCIDRGIADFKSLELLILSAKSIPGVSTDEDTKKYNERKNQRKIDIDMLLNELESLQFLSFRVSVAFRVLDLIEYKSYIRSHQDCELLAKDKNAYKEMLGVKHKILHDIEKEVNGYRSFFRRISIKIQNCIYHIRKVFKN